MTDARISRQVPLDQLVMPETDVRERRDPDSVRSLAASMGDPDVGQLQPILVTPAADVDEDFEWSADSLDEAVTAGDALRIIDGVTRFQAAEFLGWETLWAWVVAEPPEDQVIASLDANTERIDMSQFETANALYQHYQETGATQKELAEKVGYDPTYLSKLFGLIEGPDWMVEAWRNPDHPIETGHCLHLDSMLGPSALQDYADAGGLTEEEAREHAVRDAKLMVDVQAEHNCTVTEFGRRCERCRNESCQKLADGRNLNQRQADGQRERAEADHTPAETPDPDPCLICGADRPNRRKAAIPVCANDYGKIQNMVQAGDVLMANAEVPAQPNRDPLEDADPEEMAVRGLSQLFEMDPEEAAGLLQELDTQLSQAPQEADDD
jgi:hypothetical protein